MHRSTRSLVDVHPAVGRVMSIYRRSYDETGLKRALEMSAMRFVDRLLQHLASPDGPSASFVSRRLRSPKMEPRFPRKSASFPCPSARSFFPTPHFRRNLPSGAVREAPNPSGKLQTRGRGLP